MWQRGSEALIQRLRLLITTSSRSGGRYAQFFCVFGRTGRGRWVQNIFLFSFYSVYSIPMIFFFLSFPLHACPRFNKKKKGPKIRLQIWSASGCSAVPRLAGLRALRALVWLRWNGALFRRLLWTASCRLFAWAAAPLLRAESRQQRPVGTFLGGGPGRFVCTKGVKING